jgi:hypothetical protein
MFPPDSLAVRPEKFLLTDYIKSLVTVGRYL